MTTRASEIQPIETIQNNGPHGGSDASAAMHSEIQFVPPTIIKFDGQSHGSVDTVLQGLGHTTIERSEDGSLKGFSFDPAKMHKYPEISGQLLFNNITGGLESAMHSNPVAAQLVQGQLEQTRHLNPSEYNKVLSRLQKELPGISVSRDTRGEINSIKDTPTAIDRFMGGAHSVKIELPPTRH